MAAQLANTSLRMNKVASPAKATLAPVAARRTTRRMVVCASAYSTATLSAGDLAAFKADDLSELCRKKGVTGGKTATRQSLTDALVRAGTSLADLSRGQLVDLGIKLGKAGLPRDLEACRRELAALIGGSGYSAPSWGSTPAPAASSGGDRFAKYTSGGSSSAPSSYGSSAPAGGSGAGLSAGDLSALRIDDLRDLVKKVGVELPREPTKDGLINGLIAKGVSVDHLTRGMLVDMCNKLGVPMAKDAETMRRNLSGKVGGSSGGSASSWRSTPAAAPAAAAGGRFSSYTAGSSEKAAWRRSGSYSAGSTATLSASDLSAFRIDDLGELVKKVGVELPREPTKEGLVNGLVSKGVTLAHLTRGMLVDLSTKLGVAPAKDAETMRRNLSGAIGKGGSAASSTSSWRSTPAAAPASSNGSGGRFASYTGGNGNGSSSSSSSSWRTTGSSGSGSEAIYDADLAAFKIDDLTAMARKIGTDTRSATKDSLIRTLTQKLTVSDLSKGQLVEILSKIGEPIKGSVADLKARVIANASARQTARALAGARR